MSNDKPGNRGSNIFLNILRDLFGWLANVVGICLVAGGIGTAGGLFMGLPFTWALGVGVLAIVLLLALFLVFMSGGDLF